MKSRTRLNTQQLTTFQFGLYSSTVLAGIDPKDTLVVTLGLNVVIKYASFYLLYSLF